MREGVSCKFGVLCLIWLRLSWFGTPSKRGEKTCAHDDMIEVAVNLNINVNNAVLLIIIIYISNPRCRISGVAFHLDVLHHLILIVKIS
jgi:hypothetical protein